MDRPKQKSYGSTKTSLIVHTAQEDIFIEQKMIFGLVLDRLAIRKKIEPIMSNFRGQFFSCFQGQINIVVYALKSYIISLIILFGIK